VTASYDAVIIGAGNLGMWTAYGLARQGFGRIAICDRSWAGWGATSRSAGVVRQQGGSETAVKLGKLTRELYLALGSELGLDSGFTETGYFVLAATEQEQAAFLELAELRRRCGVRNEWIDADEGRRRFPQLNWDMFRGATYTPDDGYVHPPIAARNITVALAKHAGIEIFERCTVEEIDEHAGVYQLHTSRGTIQSEIVVNAGGPRGARALGKLLEVEVPVSAARHQVVTFATAGPQLEGLFPMCFALAEGIYWRPEEQGVLLGYSNPNELADETGRYQIDIDWGYHERVRPIYEAIFPPLAGQGVARAWAASIDYTPDHLPIIDEARPGFYVVAAGGHGMMWGPGLGIKMAELIAQGEVSDLPEDEISLARFSRERVHHDKIALPFPTR
jgi:sarcosine oxidase, subunit beta